jgi:uncharacterized membrane-anchored protein
MNIRPRHRSMALLLPFFLLASPNARPDDPGKSAPPPIQWTKGPMTANLGGNASIEVPDGYLFADGNGARKFMELTQNPSSGEEVGLIVPKSENEDWYVLFEFDDVGYVKDDDKSSLDAAEILKNLQSATEDSNQERTRRGWKPFHINGWYTPPFYDTETNDLTWATNGSGDNKQNPTVNYSVRILGRRGTMNVDLVLSPEELVGVEPRFKGLLKGFRFTGGNRYADFVKGDKLAGYGLTALVAGGATAVAIKTGLFAKFWKLLLVLGATILGAIKRFWKKMKSTFTGERDPKEEFPSSEVKS